MPKHSVLNKFDETCQGTVPVALKIISISKNYEDAIRLAVSLGADADTLGAIVGSIAEAIWGIPMELRIRAMEYLPQEMADVVREFHQHCPHSNKPLIDVTFSASGFKETAYDMLDSKERKEIETIVEKDKAEKWTMMELRARKREQW